MIFLQRTFIQRLSATAISLCSAKAVVGKVSLSVCSLSVISMFLRSAQSVSKVVNGGESTNKLYKHFLYGLVRDCAATKLVDSLVKAEKSLPEHKEPILLINR